MSPTASIDHVSVDKAPLYDAATGSKARMPLLWGDRVEVIGKAASHVKVRARGRSNYGWVEKLALGGQPLLERWASARSTPRAARIPHPAGWRPRGRRRSSGARREPRPAGRMG